MIGEIKDYRQPVVTSVGILLGFILNFLAGWAKGGEGGVADVTMSSSWLASGSLWCSW